MKLKYTIFIILFILTLIGGVTTCRRAGTWLVKEDKRVRADGIIMLMGSIEDRVLEAWDQCNQGNAGKVIFVVEGSMGAYQELEAKGIKIIRNAEQAGNSLITLGVPADSIIMLPGYATSTLMEAFIIKKYLYDKPDIDTLLLVTSAFHTRRASMILNNTFNGLEYPVKVFCCPSKYTDFDAKRWWRSKEGVQKVLPELLKIGNFVLFEKRRI